MDMLKNKTCTLEFESVVCSDRINKAWVTDLTTQITAAFEKIASSITL